MSSDCLKLASRSGRNTGFTLVEILVVIAIISLLAAIAIMQFSKFRVEAYDFTAKSDLNNAITALEAYFVDWDTYPATSSGLLANDLNLSQDVSFTQYQIETITAGSQTVYMVVKHASSPNSWQASYPEDGNEIEPEGKPLKNRGKRLGQFK